MKYIDIHSHLNFEQYSSDRIDIVNGLQKSEIGFITVGTDLYTSEDAVRLATSDTWSRYATVGIHPTHIYKLDGKKNDDEDFDNLKLLAKSDFAVAIGECGLDYYRLDKTTSDLQKEVFIRQIEIANELGKPLMLHIRNAYSDALEILRTYAKVRGNVHFFVGNWDEAKLFLDLGFTLSFTGVITFARDYDEVIKNTPLDMMLPETDSPFVSPQPLRGKRNVPDNVVYVVNKIAEIRGQSEETVRIQLIKNAERVFNITP